MLVFFKIFPSASFARYTINSYFYVMPVKCNVHSPVGGTIPGKVVKFVEFIDQESIECQLGRIIETTVPFMQVSGQTFKIAVDYIVALRVTSSLSQGFLKHLFDLTKL